MDMTIEKLKVGDRLIFGKYGVTNEHPEPVSWLKATPNCDFITENALDYLCFDAREHADENYYIKYGGNRSYKLSNLLSFLNSDEAQWYHPTHPKDSPPNRNNTDRYGEYESHIGFLYYFEEYEVNSLISDAVLVDGEQISSAVRLPLIREVVGEDRFKLFHKRGIRPKASDNMIQIRRTGFEPTSYIDFWAAGTLTSENEVDNFKARVVSRSGCIETKHPSERAGVRPVCRIKGETTVVLGEDGFYRIKPYPAQTNACTDSELLDLLGITRT